MADVAAINHKNPSAAMRFNSVQSNEEEQEDENEEQNGLYLNGLIDLIDY